MANGHHWDPRYPNFAGSFDGTTIHSHHYIDPTDPLDSPGVAARTFVSTRSGAWVMPKYVFGRPLDTVVRTNPHVPLRLQRRIAGLAQHVVSGDPQRFGLPKPNDRFLEAHPTVSSEFLLRLGSGDAVAKPDVAELQGDRVRFVDGTVEPVDVIVYATGYKITFPFFDPEFLAAPDNKLRLYKRMFVPASTT